MSVYPYIDSRYRSTTLNLPSSLRNLIVQTRNFLSAPSELRFSLLPLPFTSSRGEIPLKLPGTSRFSSERSPKVIHAILAALPCVYVSVYVCTCSYIKIILVSALEAIVEKEKGKSMRDSRVRVPNWARSIGRPFSLPACSSYKYYY